MENDFVGVILAFIIGAMICFANFKLSEYFLKKHTEHFSKISFLRQIIQVLYILVLFFIAKYTPWDRTFVLIGGALGVTLPMFIFTYKLLKTNKTVSVKKEEKEESSDG
ncbi:MAG: hypothetical protein IKL10_05905 [Clostridia bacterium]|nr:hypothetical protein [Clostridia bacterium]